MRRGFREVERFKIEKLNDDKKDEEKGYKKIKPKTDITLDECRAFWDDKFKKDFNESVNDLIDELKLVVYESSFDWEDKLDIVEIIESCETEEDLDVICEAVSNNIGSALDGAAMVIHASNIKNAYSTKKIIDIEKQTLEDYKKSLQKLKDAKNIPLEAKKRDIASWENAIKEKEERIKSLKKQMAISGGLGAAGMYLSGRSIARRAKEEKNDNDKLYKYMRKDAERQHEEMKKKFERDK